MFNNQRVDIAKLAYTKYCLLKYLENWKQAFFTLQRQNLFMLLCFKLTFNRFISLEVLFS